jgi:hypothetical protein
MTKSTPTQRGKPTGKQTFTKKREKRVNKEGHAMTKPKFMRGQNMTTLA